MSPREETAEANHAPEDEYAPEDDVLSVLAEAEGAEMGWLVDPEDPERFVLTGAGHRWISWWDRAWATPAARPAVVRATGITQPRRFSGLVWIPRSDHAALLGMPEPTPLPQLVMPVTGEPE